VHVADLASENAGISFIGTVHSVMERYIVYSAAIVSWRIGDHFPIEGVTELCDGNTSEAIADAPEQEPACKKSTLKANEEAETKKQAGTNPLPNFLMAAYVYSVGLSMIASILN
jgi:hypothetical protein